MLLFATMLVAAQDIQVAVPAEVLSACSGDDKSGCEVEEIDLTERGGGRGPASVVLGGIVGALPGGGNNFFYCRTDRGRAAVLSEHTIERSFKAQALHRQASGATASSSEQVFLGYRPSPSPERFYYIGVNLAEVPVTAPGSRSCRIRVKSVAWSSAAGRHSDAVSRQISSDLRSALK